MWRKLFGTLASFFRIGLTGPRLSNDNGLLRVQNAAGTDDANVRVGKLELHQPGNPGAPSMVVQSSVAGGATAWFLTLPPNAGSPAQVLTTDGAGLASWTTVSGGADKAVTDTTTLAFGDSSPKTMFTLPANAVVLSVKVVVDTPFNGAPSLSVGVTGTVSKYLGSSDVDLTFPVGTSFEVTPDLPANGSPENLIATYAAGGASAGSARILVSYVTPS